MDFGLNVSPDKFSFGSVHCSLPSSLVMAYAFAVAASGHAKQLLLAGFDGYPGEDPRNTEMNHIVKLFKATEVNLPLIAITPSRYDVVKKSIYGELE